MTFRKVKNSSIAGQKKKRRDDDGHDEAGDEEGKTWLILKWLE